MTGLDELQKALETKAKYLIDLNKEDTDPCKNCFKSENWKSQYCCSCKFNYTSFPRKQFLSIDDAFSVFRQSLPVSVDLQKQAKTTCDLFKLINEEDPDCQDDFACQECEHQKVKWLSLDVVQQFLIGKLEKLGELEHKQWISLMEHLIDVGALKNPKLWNTELETPYSELSEVDKEKDRVFARKILKVFAEDFAKDKSFNLRVHE